MAAFLMAQTEPLLRIRIHLRSWIRVRINGMRIRDPEEKQNGFVSDTNSTNADIGFYE
jgi:hypothetical protein